MGLELYKNAERYKGINEIPGKDNNNELITSWLKLCLPDQYLGAGKFDETSWCSAFVHGVFIETYGWQEWDKFVKSVGVNSLAKSWKKVDEGFIEVSMLEARRGDIVIMDRGKHTWQGHIGFFDRYAIGNVHVLGGNQSDTVNVSIYPGRKVENILRVNL